VSIVLESIVGNSTKELIRIEYGALSIGREPENDLVVDSSSISRRHGCIVNVSTHWVFKDLHSSNGSWVNGIRIFSGQLKLLRHGDVLQLADFYTRISFDPKLDVIGDSSKYVPSLIVLHRDDFQSDFSLGAQNSKLEIGGVGANLLLENIATPGAIITIVNNGTTLELSSHSSEVPVFINGLVVSGTIALGDRDEVLIGEYKLIVNDLRVSTKIDDEVLARVGENEQVQAHISESKKLEGNWVSEASRRKQLQSEKFVFGQDDEMTKTGMYKAATSGRFGPEMSLSQKFSAIEEEEDLSGKNDNLLVVSGVLIFLALIAGGIYFGGVYFGN
jgi:FHA domain